MRPAFEKVWNLVPRTMQDLVASAVDRAQGIEIPIPPTVSSASPIRVFIGPTNYAGQGFRWGKAAEMNPLVQSRNMVGAEDNAFGYEVDYPVRWRTMNHSRKWQKALFATLASSYTHVMFEAEMPVLGGMFGGDMRKQIAALRAAGVKVGMICHGTDVRLPSRHRELEAWSYFSNDDWAPVDLFEQVVQKNIDLINEVNAPTFVSTPGLLLDIPQAHLLPVVISPEVWANDTPVLTRERPRVLHVPSNPLPKGTLHIAPALERLHHEGTIEYVQLHGRTHAEMPDLYAGADIVLDQFRAGDYGVGSCEAMAAGRVVIGHVSEQARTAVRQLSGLDLPIVEANIDNIEQVLRGVVAQRDRYRAQASLGPTFVRTVHDGRLARVALERHFFEL